MGNFLLFHEQERVKPPSTIVSVIVAILVLLLIPILEVGKVRVVDVWLEPSASMNVNLLKRFLLILFWALTNVMLKIAVTFGNYQMIISFYLSKVTVITAIRAPFTM